MMPAHGTRPGTPRQRHHVGTRDARENQGSAARGVGLPTEPASFFRWPSCLLSPVLSSRRAFATVRLRRGCRSLSAPHAGHSSLRAPPPIYFVALWPHLSSLAPLSFDFRRHARVVVRMPSQEADDTTHPPQCSKTKTDVNPVCPVSVSPSHAHTLAPALDVRGGDVHSPCAARTVVAALGQMAQIAWAREARGDGEAKSGVCE